MCAFEVILRLWDHKSLRMNTKARKEGSEGTICPMFSLTNGPNQKAKLTAALKTLFYYLEDLASEQFVAHLKSNIPLVILLFMYVEGNAVPRLTVQLLPNGKVTSLPQKVRTNIFRSLDRSTDQQGSLRGLEDGR